MVRPRGVVRAMAYRTKIVGEPKTFDFRVFVEEDGKTVSPWHEIPLKNADGSYNFFCEIPKVRFSGFHPP